MKLDLYENRSPGNHETPEEFYRRKANQAWEMAGLARQDGDMADCAKQTEMAREYDRLAREARNEEPIENAPS